MKNQESFGVFSRVDLSCEPLQGLCNERHEHLQRDLQRDLSTLFTTGFKQSLCARATFWKNSHQDLIKIFQVSDLNYI